MSSASIELAKHVLLAFAVILATGAAGAVAAQKLRVPDVVVFLLAGVILGPSVAGVIDIRADSTLNQLVLIFGSCYILFDGGASLRLRVLQDVWISIVALASLGVVITATVTGVAAYYVLNVPWVVAFLLAATIASTDPATLVPVFRQVKIKDRVAQTVMSESAFNDATGAILTIALLAIAIGKGDVSIPHALVDLVKQSVFGIVAGGVLGYCAAFVIAHERFGFLEEYAPLVSLMTVVAAYLTADGLQASGFMAVFVFGIAIGNKDAFGFEMQKGEQEKLDDFVLTTSLIMRIFIFMLLGTQVDFSAIEAHWLGGAAVVIVFMFVARPLTVFLCAAPDLRAKWSRNELLFMCWTRETGVIPGALAGLLIGMGAPQAHLIAAVTFIAILVTILVQATTTRWLAAKLGLLVGE